MGKGSKRRDKEDTKKIVSNWSEIDWDYKKKNERKNNKRSGRIRE